MLGIVAGLLFTLLLPTVSHFVFTDTIRIPYEMGAISGLLISMVCTSRASGSLALVALRRIKTIMFSALAGAAIGIPAILIGARFFGATGALWGEVLSEIVVLAIQFFAFRGVARFRKDRQ
jgi:hypothetical protein